MSDGACTVRNANEATASQATPPRTGQRIFTGHVFRVRGGRGWRFSEKAPALPPVPSRRPARVARMLALAHRLQAAVDRGDYRDRAELARQLGFTRARVTQILDLLLLAPDIQERVLDLEAVDGIEPLTERALREVVRHEGWDEQRRVWRMAGPSGSSPG
jgi:hypothetical protein